MSFYTKGKKDGIQKKHKPPKKDGFLGSSLGQSKRSEQRQTQYSKGHNAGQKERARRQNWIQRLLD